MKVEDRFWAKVEKTETCWLWTACKHRAGYGFFRVGGRNLYAHRWAYELLVGQIPPDLELDHLCRVPACVNPAHLEAVTPRVNTLRGLGPAALNSQKTHCPQGHPYDTENTFLRTSGRRLCRTCHRARTRAWQARRKNLVVA